MVDRVIHVPLSINSFIHSIQIKSTEANGFATILRRVLLYNLPNIFKDISDELRSLLLQQMFVLTCHFIESSIHEDTVINYVQNRVEYSFLILIVIAGLFIRISIHRCIRCNPGSVAAYYTRQRGTGNNESNFRNSTSLNKTKLSFSISKPNCSNNRLFKSLTSIYSVTCHLRTVSVKPPKISRVVTWTKSNKAIEIGTKSN